MVTGWCGTFRPVADGSARCTLLALTIIQGGLRMRTFRGRVELSVQMP